MTPAAPEPHHTAPFGAQIPRSPAPLYAAIAAYAVWFGVLVWLALAYPAAR